VALSLAACSNNAEGQVSALGTVQGLLKRAPVPKVPNPEQVAAMSAQTLAGTSGPVILFALPDRKQITTLVRIETNRGYETYGSSDRRTVTLKGGMITATRGLGEDIMSVDISGVAPLIRAAREGAAYRTNRHLDGENITVAERSYCQIKIGSQSQIPLGAGSAQVTEVLESCVTDDLAYQNAYYITQGGRIVQSRQWHSPLNGYVIIQQLR